MCDVSSGVQKEEEEASLLIVKLFTNSQAFQTFENIKRGDILLLTDLRLISFSFESPSSSSSSSSSSSPSRLVLCRSTNDTQVYPLRFSSENAATTASDRSIREQMPSGWHGSTRETILQAIKWSSSPAARRLLSSPSDKVATLLNQQGRVTFHHHFFFVFAFCNCVGAVLVFIFCILHFAFAFAFAFCVLFLMASNYLCSFSSSGFGIPSAVTT